MANFCGYFCVLNLFRILTITTSQFFVCTFLGSLYCKLYEPRLDGSLRSSLIRVQSVCFHEENSLKYI